MRTLPAWAAKDRLKGTSEDAQTDALNLRTLLLFIISPSS
jgi:hypothetical protein